MLEAVRWDWVQKKTRKWNKKVLTWTWLGGIDRGGCSPSAQGPPSHLSPEKQNWERENLWEELLPLEVDFRLGSGQEILLWCPPSEIIFWVKGSKERFKKTTSLTSTVLLFSWSKTSKASTTLPCTSEDSTYIMILFLCRTYKKHQWYEHWTTPGARS